MYKMQLPCIRSGKRNLCERATERERKAKIRACLFERRDEKRKKNFKSIF